MCALFQFVASGWTLTIEDLMLEDNGNYMCVVANEYGSIQWNFTVEALRKLALLTQRWL